VTRIRSLSFAALIAATCLAAPGAAKPADAPNPTFTGRDLFDLSAASDPQISPDGRQIAYVRRSNDIMSDRAVSSIWLIDVATGAQRPLITEGSASSPRWSPDGRRLAYVGAEGGAPQLFVRWMDSGASAKITGLPDSPSAISWSPTGRQIAYLMTVPDDGARLGKTPDKPEGAKWADPLQVIDKVTYRADGAGYLKPGFDHIFVVDALGGAPRQLTYGAYNDGDPEWSRDGRAIYFGGLRKPNWELIAQDGEIYRFDLDSGAVTALTSRNGPDFSPTVSPDGRWIAFLGHDDHKKGFEQDSIYVMPASGGAPRLVAAGLDRGVQQIAWGGDSGSIYASYEQEGSVTVSRIGLNGSVTPLTHSVGGGGLDRPYAGGGFSVARNGAIAFTTDSPGRPADVAVASNPNNLRRLTDLNATTLSAKAMGGVTTLNVRAPDGGRVPTWVILPPGYKQDRPLPAILEIHGGPYASYGPHFSTDYQLYAAAGYAVIYTNPRGSTGYGQAFADGIEKTYPGSNFDDLMAAVDGAVAAGIADPNNLFVTGGSGGGILTAWIVGKTNRFKAAAAQKPVINWTSMALTSDGPNFFGPYWLGYMPWENADKSWARSPLSLIGNVTTPTLVVVGAEDYRTPVSEAEQYYTALKLKGVPTMFVKVPGASHGGIAARPSQSAAKASAIIAWFDRYRAGKGGQPVASNEQASIPAAQ
jgi:dipeptidyl aminopeptidase/acylaminoacyl peptidase